MSKRELVSYIRAVTGLSFKESRKICKKSKYNYSLAYYLAVKTLINQETIKYYEEPFNNPQAELK